MSADLSSAQLDFSAPWRVHGDRRFRGDSVQLQATRIPAALARFLIRLQADGRSPHTIAKYERHVAGFAEWAGPRGLDAVRAIEPDHVATFLGSPRATHRHDGRRCSAVTVNALRSSLRGFYEFLERAGIVDRSPARVLRMAHTAATAPRGLRADEVERNGAHVLRMARIGPTLLRV